MGASGAESLAKDKRAGTLIGRIGDTPPALSRSESDRRVSAIPSDGRRRPRPDIPPDPELCPIVAVRNLVGTSAVC